MKKTTANVDQKQLIFNALEHITNVTNVGLKLREIDNNLVISFPVREANKAFNFTPQGEHPEAELIFCQNQQNDLLVCYKFPDWGSASRDEIIEEIPAASVHEKVIYESVIAFLETVKNR